MTKEELANISVPRHIGIIMDGNGRWAEQRGLNRCEGHKEGARVFREICEYSQKAGIEYLTFYAFSTENWKRPPEEVSAIMNLFKDYLSETKENKNKNGMRIRYIGNKSVLPADIVNLINELENCSDFENTITINLAVNYGGRDEILHAVKNIAKKVEAGEIRANDIELKDIDGNLYTAGQPDPDLIIRPGGEYRLSNFLIWQSAYSEFWFSDILWPDFTVDDLDKAIIDFTKRNRRFGGV